MSGQFPPTVAPVWSDEGEYGRLPYCSAKCPSYKDVRESLYCTCPHTGEAVDYVTNCHWLADTRLTDLARCYECEMCVPAILLLSQGVKP